MIDDLRSLEYPQLNTGIFVDYGGSFPMCQSQISRIEDYNCDPLLQYSNQIDQEIEELKDQILTLLNTDSEHYDIFFFPNTTAAIRSFAFAFPWNKDSTFIYHADNHNSILGIRKVAEHFGSKILGVPSFPKTIPKTTKGYNIFSYSTQSNVTGSKLPLSWVSSFESNPNSFVFLDLAAAAPTCPPDFSLPSCSPYAAVLSLLKLTGAPGGVLLLRKDIQPPLKICEPPLDRLSLISAYAGLKVRNQLANSLGTSPASHVHNLAKFLHQYLSKLHHENGAKVVELYPSEFLDVEQQGGTFAFNFFSADGAPIPHDSIYNACTANSIFLRFGVHCNPGATYRSLNWKPNEIEAATRQHEAACSLTASIMEGRHVGTIRVSFGVPSNQKDVDRLIAFIENHFVQKTVSIQKVPQSSIKDLNLILKAVYTRPIKGGRAVPLPGNVRMTRSGILYDGWWGIADEESRMLDRARCPKLLSLEMEITDKDLIVKRNDGQTISISLMEHPKGTKFTSSTACHEKIGGEIYSPEVNQWFTEALGRNAILVRVENVDMKPLRAFFTSSLNSLGISEIDLQRFEPQLLFESEKKFAEDEMVGNQVMLNDLQFFVTERIPLSTAAMLGLNGEESEEPLRTICLEHGTMGRACLGVHLKPKFVPSRKNPKELIIGSVFQ